MLGRVKLRRLSSFNPVSLRGAVSAFVDVKGLEPADLLLGVIRQVIIGFIYVDVLGVADRFNESRGMSRMKVDGGCHCGAITYEAVVDPEKVAICHCADCQHLSGTAYRAVVPAAARTFRLLTGEPRKYIKTADSGARRVHAFCANCGTPVYSSAVDDPPAYNLRLGTIRQRAYLAPRRQNWFRSAQSWVTNLEHIPRFDRM